MRISIVTISFNQGMFIERAIKSVLNQDYDDIEFIVVDPGSRDNSREIIERYEARISSIIFRPDNGPADGLNKGFEKATGDIFAFLNADDVLLPGAVKEAIEYFRKNPNADVVYGNSLILDDQDNILRRSYSDPYSLFMRAYKACVIMQPSTFFRSSIFQSVNGFNSENLSNWDGELFTDFGLSNARFRKVNLFWSGYRIQKESITGSGKLDDKIQRHYECMFLKVIGREANLCDKLIMLLMKPVRYLLNPRDFYERVVNGPIYKRAL